jgi:hypothetical protein
MPKSVVQKQLDLKEKYLEKIPFDKIVKRNGNYSYLEGR